MKKATAIFSAAVLALAVWVITLTLSLRDSIISYDIGPAVYPRLLCFVLILFAVLLFAFEGILKKEDAPLVFLKLVNVLHIALAFAFLLAMEHVGFPICAFVVLVVMMKIMGCPKLWQILSFSAVASAAVFAVFRLLLKVRLPLGLLEFLF